MKVLKNAWFLTFGVLALTFLLGQIIVDPFGYKSVALLFLASVSLLAVVVELKEVLAAATLSALLWNFFFIPPLYTFHIEQSDDLVLFMTYFLIAFVASILSYRLRKQRLLLERQRSEERRIALYETIINSISHELKTPLSIIQSGVEILRKAPNSNNSGAVVEELEISAQRLHFQLNNLLNMSQVESGLSLVKPAWIDLHDVMYRVRRMESRDAQSRISVRLTEDFPLVYLDEPKLEIILHNLVHNAIVHNSLLVNVHMNATVIDDGIRLSIEDDGTGILEEEQIRVFEKFFRGSSNVGPGSGLGLSIVKGFADLMNGKLTLTSAKGRTCFELYLPCDVSFLNKIKNE